MARDFLTCPFCGFEFAVQDTLCQHGCPLGSLCNLTRCPNCQYEFAETPRTVRWFEGLLRRRREPPRSMPHNIQSVADLDSGQAATVMCLGTGTTDRHNNLAVFGIVPGARISLLQQRPACVIRVGETELALDPEIAREILVDPQTATDSTS